MNNREEFRESLKYKSDEELGGMLWRALGESTRILDRAVQEFFTQPIGTKIYIYDHYGTRQADQYLLGRAIKRLETEHHVEYKKGVDSNGFYILRTEPTLQEMILDEIERRKGNE